MRATKRRGYRASSAATLDARERSYEAQRDRSCDAPCQRDGVLTAASFGPDSPGVVDARVSAMSATHEVTNQVPPLLDYNLYRIDRTLQQAVAAVRRRVGR